jgi:hypothetical protein
MAREELFYIISETPDGLLTRGCPYNTFAQAYKSIIGILHMWSEMTEGVVIKLVSVKNGKIEVLELAAVDEIGINKIIEMTKNNI